MRLLLVVFCISIVFNSCNNKLNSLNDDTLEISSINGELLSFNQKISDDDFDYYISLAGTGDIRFLDIRVGKNGVFIAKLNDEIEGTIYNIFISDLNKNSKPEIILLINSNDLKNNITIIGFEFNKNSFKRFDMPQLEEDNIYGIINNEHFLIKGSQIIREFDVLNPQNNLNITKRLIYNLNNNLELVLYKQNDL